MKITVIIALSAFMFFLSCEERDYKRYETLVKRELASGTRHDSLFFGIYLGMSSKQFYTHCWKMNKKGLFTDGEGNTAVLYRIDKELKYPASMNFYPKFYKDKIYKMGVSFKYDGWAPWNKHLFADSLKQDVIKLYERWYPMGNAFLEVENEVKGIVNVKVDGNRRIIIGRSDDLHVRVDYTDLIVEEQLKKN